MPEIMLPGVHYQTGQVYGSVKVLWAIKQVWAVKSLYPDCDRLEGTTCFCSGPVFLMIYCALMCLTELSLNIGIIPYLTECNL